MIKIKKAINTLNLSLLILLSGGIVSFSAIAEDKHKVDMKKLKQYCQTHSQEACHIKHIEIHLRHHAGTEKDFHDHYQKEHGKKKGRIDKE